MKKDTSNPSKIVKEKITMTLRGEWICTCGNDYYNSGFSPINDKNEIVEPAKPEWNTNNYICNHCGRVINQDTLEVVKIVELKG